MPSVTGALIGGLSAVGGIASAAIGSGAAKDAAHTQAKAAKNAAQAQLRMFNETSRLLSPFLNAGTKATYRLQNLTGTSKRNPNPLTAPLTSPFRPTMEQLEQTPGYQFALDQGLKATQNSFAAQGLGQSGAAMKGASQFAEGLASTTYQQQFQNYLAQNQQIYNMLGGLGGLGESAGAKVGQMGMQAQSQANALTTSGAAAGAAGTIGAANALTGGISNAIGGVSQAAMLASLANSGMFGGGAGGALNLGNAEFPLPGLSAADYG